ncbi:glycosyltransferase family 39 protein [Candidatus Desantisbacteria bacterium]|nr:glycosyltransferase family 39 protein [Candidatus Desantisbacteria bacterium]
MKINDPNFLHLTGTDQGAYDSAAQAVLDGTLPKEPYYYNPGYYYFLALIYLVCGHNLDTALKVQFLIGLSTYFLIYLIAKRIFNKTVGFIAISLCSLYGIFMIYEGLFLSSVLETFLLALSIFLLLQNADKPSAKGFFFTGIIIGLSVLTRPNIILLIPIYFLWIATRLWSQKKRLLLVYLVMTIGIIGIISPVTIRNYTYSGKFILVSSNGPINFWIGNNPDATGSYRLSPFAKVLEDRMKKEGRDLWVSDALTFIKERPEQYVKLLLKKFCLFWASYEPADNDIVYERMKGQSSLLRMPFILGFGIIASLGLGGILLSLRRWWGKGLLLYLVILGYMSTVIAFFVQSRFRVAMIPYLIVFAGFCLYYWYDKFQKKEYKKLYLSLCPAIIFYLMVNFQTYFGWTHPYFHPNGEYVESRNGLIIRDDSGEWHGKEVNVLDSPDKIIKKELIINSDISQFKDAVLILNYFANDQGELLIKVNEYQFPKISCSQITYGQFMRLAKLGFKPNHLKRGINIITLRVTPTAIVQIPTDNWRNYGRSYFSSNGIDWERIEEEFMIEIELSKTTQI